MTTILIWTILHLYIIRNVLNAVCRRPAQLSCWTSCRKNTAYCICIRGQSFVRPEQRQVAHTLGCFSRVFANKSTSNAAGFILNGWWTVTEAFWTARLLLSSGFRRKWSTCPCIFKMTRFSWAWGMWWMVLYVQDVSLTLYILVFV
jgi:hypothetical protein